MPSLPSFQIFDNLPIYAKLIDDRALLEHFSNALQPQYDSILNRLDLREVFFNPALCPEEWLDYLGQYVGLATVGGDYLGIGINPDWEPAQKRLAIERANKYWANKGTEWGVREAIAIWLQWEQSHNNQLIIELPFGDSPTAYPPQWWDYATSYDLFLNQTYAERKQFGSGDYEQTYQPDYFTLEAPDPVQLLQEYGSVWNDRTLVQIDPPVLSSVGSALGPDRPWMHFELVETEWNRITPDILYLNPEIWSTHAEPEVFTWLVCKTEALLLEADREQNYLIEERLYYDGFKYGDLWAYSCGSSTVSSEQISFETFGLEPGHGYTDFWTGQFAACPEEYLYYVPYDDHPYLETITTTTVVDCTPGFEAEVITGYDEQIIPGQPAQAASFLFEQQTGYDLTINLEGLSLDLSDITINLSSIPAVGLDVALETKDLYPVAETPYVSGHGIVWDEGAQYYFAGSLPTPDTIQELPVVESVELCNFVDRYSLRIIERELITIPIDDTGRALTEIYPGLPAVLNGANWALLVESLEELYYLKPVTLFWQYPDGSRSQQFSAANASNLPALYLEFVFHPKAAGSARSCTLLLNHQSIQAQQFTIPLNLSQHVAAGIRFTVPISLEDFTTVVS